MHNLKVEWPVILFAWDQELSGTPEFQCQNQQWLADCASRLGKAGLSSTETCPGLVKAQVAMVRPHLNLRYAGQGQRPILCISNKLPGAAGWSATSGRTHLSEGAGLGTCTPRLLHVCVWPSSMGGSRGVQGETHAPLQGGPEGPASLPGGECRAGPTTQPAALSTWGPASGKQSQPPPRLA
jgi:hypothetical protein